MRCSRRFVAQTQAQLDAWRATPSEHDRPDVAAARGAWHAGAPTWDPTRLVFLDETGITTNLLRRYGRATRGTRVHDHTPGARWQTSTFLAALRVTGLTAPGVFDGAIDGTSFLTRAYTRPDVKAARRLLHDLARRLDADYPSAAASVREGLDETLTVIGLGLSARLQRSLATTNAVESLLSRTRHVKHNVKRWRGGAMVLRWVAAGVLEAAKGFRRLKGYTGVLQLVVALRARDAKLGLGDSAQMVA